MRNWKTNLVAIIGVIILLIAMLLVYFGKTTLTEVGQFLGPIAVFLGIILGFVSKDHNVTGSAK